MKKTRVLIVDDSALIRRLLTEILEGDSAIEVVATAADPYAAREKIKAHNPDVLTLDVEMPRMDGVTFLSNLMRLRPMPVVMVSSLTENGAEVTLKALELGAVDFIAKPKVDIARGLREYAWDLREKVATAAAVPVSRLERYCRQPAAAARPGNAPAGAGRESAGAIGFRTTEQLVAVGASTGGTEAIKEILLAMPEDAPGIVVTQHIPAAFSKPFAERMNAASAMTVCEAFDGQQILPGHAYIAPGDMHLLIERSGARFFCRLNAGPAVNRHRPSVDVMYRSIVDSAGANAVGVLLTGMGSDGADGLVEMRKTGAHTIAQDRETSVVWGMPGAAVERGGVDRVVPLEAIPRAILEAVEGRVAACGAGG